MVSTNAVQAAQSTLGAYTQGAPVAVPVDPFAIARSLGINVYEATLPNTLSGMIGRMHESGEIDIVVNTEHAPVRQRFTVAHELGHYFAIMADPKRSDAPFIHRRDQLAACGTSQEEIFANQFAAELLMPGSEVKRLRATGMDTPRLASHFKVSFDAMNNRLKNLGVI